MVVFIYQECLVNVYFKVNYFKQQIQGGLIKITYINI